MEDEIMNKLFLLSVLMSLTVFSLFAQPVQDSTKMNGNLIVVVEGINNEKGSIQIGLFQSKDSWNGKTGKLRGAIIPVKSCPVEWKVENISFGEYAIKVFHDENGDNNLNTNFLGMPTERYGFSNNPKTLFGPPSFENAKFVFCCKDTSITIVLR
jgi:uncharacterized protein (DUF2141 family)